MKRKIEIKQLLNEEIIKSQNELNRAQRILDLWSGSGRTADLAREIVNLHWPRIAFINALLEKRTINPHELEIVHRGTLKEDELKHLLSN